MEAHDSVFDRFTSERLQVLKMQKYGAWVIAASAPLLAPILFLLGLNSLEPISIMTYSMILLTWTAFVTFGSLEFSAGAKKAYPIIDEERIAFPNPRLFAGSFLIMIPWSSIVRMQAEILPDADVQLGIPQGVTYLRVIVVTDDAKELERVYAAFSAPRTNDHAKLASDLTRAWERNRKGLTGSG